MLRLSLPPSLGGRLSLPGSPLLFVQAGEVAGDRLAWSRCTTLCLSAACRGHRTRGTSSRTALPARLSGCEISWPAQKASIAARLPAWPASRAHPSQCGTPQRCQNTVAAGLDTAHFWGGLTAMRSPSAECPRAKDALGTAAGQESSQTPLPPIDFFRAELLPLAIASISKYYWACIITVVS